jgi:aconitate hydratase 2/2-methylisocitrate dehydratase
LIQADADAEYVEILEINLADIEEPILCCPNDPDDAKSLSEVAGTKIDEVFIGSCMTNIGHFRAAGKLLQQFEGTLPTRLWMSPPTKMDQAQLTEEGYYDIYANAGVRLEMSGCSLCMGNQARVEPNSTVLSTSTRNFPNFPNFPNCLGDDANVYLCSAEIAAVGAIMGKTPSTQEYMAYATKIESMSAEVFKYLNFDRMDAFKAAAEAAKANIIPALNIASC